MQQSIDISYPPPGPQQQTRRTVLQWAHETDRRTDAGSGNNRLKDQRTE